MGPPADAAQARESLMMSRTLGTRTAALALVGLAGLLTGTARAGEVKLDFTNFDTRLDELASSAGVSNFSAAEKTQIRSGIKSVMESAYSGFDLTFTESPSGGVGTYTTVLFGLSATPGSYGLADGIDYRNKDIDDRARVFSANFDFIVESGDARATQIAELTAALGGTAAHELGHNLGLRHYDSYGDTSLTWNNGSPITTGGVQNTHIMATGSTGISEAQREATRTFSALAYAKLNFAAQVLNSPLSSVVEQAFSHSSIATAQAIAWSNLLVPGASGYQAAANVIGSLGLSFDVYAVNGVAGALLTANLLGAGVDGIDDPLADSYLYLYDSDGNVLAFNGDIAYSTTQLYAGALRTYDSLILNYVLPTTGTYYIGVGGGISPPSDNYELLLATTQVVPLPPASGLGLLGLVGLVVVRRVRRRRAA